MLNWTRIIQTGAKLIQNVPAKLIQNNPDGSQIDPEWSRLESQIDPENFKKYL